MNRKIAKQTNGRKSVNCMCGHNYLTGIKKQAFYIMHTFSTSADEINKRRLKQTYCVLLLFGKLPISSAEIKYVKNKTHGLKIIVP